MTFYVATTNPGKLRDFAAAAGPSGITLEPLPGLAEIAAPPEDGTTFQENAASKARYYSAQRPGLVVLADDSGLEVEALGGAPGVRSARYAEDRGYQTRRPLPADQRNNLCLLDALATTREEFRQARFRCALVAARDGEVLSAAEGAVEGEIIAVPRGNEGFGYDPLFLLPELGLTMGEIAPADRLEVSHRGRALTALMATRELVQEIAQTGR